MNNFEREIICLMADGITPMGIARKLGHKQYYILEVLRASMKNCECKTYAHLVSFCWSVGILYQEMGILKFKKA